MSKRSGSYPRVRAEGGGLGVVSQSGAVLLVETARKAGLDAAISTALAPWRTARTLLLDAGPVVERVRLFDELAAFAAGADADGWGCRRCGVGRLGDQQRT